MMLSSVFIPGCLIIWPHIECFSTCICKWLLGILASKTLYKLLNKRNPYLTSVAYYLDFGNSNPHYLVPNCSAINLESNDGNHKRFAHVTRVGQVQGGYLAKSGSFSTSMVTIRNNFCALTISLEYRTSATGL